MTPNASYLILLVAATAVVKGAGWLVEAACIVAREHRAERYLAGLTVTALAVSVPQVLLAARAALSGEPELAAGVAVGGCAANIGLVLGGGLLVLRLRPTGGQVALLAGGVATAGALAGLLIRDGLLSRSEGLWLLAAFCAACLACRRAWAAGRWRVRRPDATAAGDCRSACSGCGPADVADRRPVLPRLVLGTLFLAAGSRYAVVAGGALAAYLRLAPDVAGRTMLSLGACVPEAAATTAAAFKGWPDLALGCLTGAAIVNLTLVLGVTGAIRPFAVGAGTILLHLPLVILLALLLVVFGLLRQTLGREEGAAVLAVYLAYFWFAFR